MVMSELSSYLKGHEISNSFLEMIVSLVSSKQLNGGNNFHASSGAGRSRHQDLVTFSCQAITNLVTPTVEATVMDRILQLLMDL